MVKVAKTHEPDACEMREAYCGALLELAKVNDRIALINCDLCSSMGLKKFAEAYPERSVNVGIQEANGCSMAAGMSAAGLVPYFNTFAIFASRRIYDQIFMSCAYQDLNVKIFGGDAGVSATYNGGTHMAFEDVGILRVMPNVQVIEPSDAVMMRDIATQLADTYGVQYVRFPRKKAVKIYEDGSTFRIGKGNVIREGTDATVIAYGVTVIEALKAAEELSHENIEVRVIDMFTIKPLDVGLVLESAAKTGAIVTAENHQIIGGLGSAVAEALSENIPTPLERVGVKDIFGEVGTQDYLTKHFGLSAEHVAQAVKNVIRRKQER